MYAITVKHIGAFSSHCATVCRHQNGVLVAYYEGYECTDTQRIALEYWERDKMVGRMTLPYRTGNCVLIPAKQNQATLIFSYFTDTDGEKAPINPVQRWMYCTNWKVRIRFSNNRFKVSEEEILGIQPHIGLLTRCSPIWSEGKWLLPLYREHNCYGLIADSEDGWNWTKRGEIGSSKHQINGRFGSGILIQPTIWHDGNEFQSLSRDVTTNRLAWHSKSPDAKIWSTPEPSKIDNYNNSIVVIGDRKENPTYMVWNMGHHRQTLCLGRFYSHDVPALPTVNFGPGSYPNYCWDYDGLLHIVYTSNRQITHHIISRDALMNLTEVDVPTTPRELGWKVTNDQG